MEVGPPETRCRTRFLLDQFSTPRRIRKYAMIRLNLYTRHCFGLWWCRLLAIQLGLICLATLPAIASDLRRSPIVKAVQSASPAVVNIHGRKSIRNRSVGRNSQPAERQVNGMGTGIIFDARGYILTNYHVVQGVSSIVVTQHDQTVHTAKLIARDESSDLAIIKIPTRRRLSTIRIGDSSTLLPGETVIAVGNAYGYSHTVTRGIISALNRNVQVNESQRYVNLIQTDASINPGNSGGPLLNIDGEMIGVNVAVRIGAQGIGFAIPSNDALEIAARLLSESRPRLTFGVQAVTHYYDGTSSYVVRKVDADSSAAAQGVKPGDVILDIGGITVHNRLDYERALLQLPPDNSFSVSLQRDRERLRLKCSLVPLSATGTPANKRIWEEIGVRFAPVSRNLLGTHQKRYRGGLRILQIRPGSLAEKNGLLASDVLLGIHKWETVSLDNLSYILASPEYKTESSLKFYLLRNQQILFGQLVNQSGS